jgi:hypothetical protein
VGDESPIEETAAGVARGTIEALADKAKLLIQWVAAGKLRFLGDPDTVSETKKRKRSPEWEALKGYVDAPDLRTQVLIGLELRDLDASGQRTRLEDARVKLVRRYGREGLHVAQLAKLGIVTDLISELIKRYQDPSDVRFEVTTILAHADARVRFVQAVDAPHSVARTVEQRLDAHGTQLLIAKGNARVVLENTLTRLKKGQTRVFLDTGPEESQAYAILFREDVWPEETEITGPGRDATAKEKPVRRRHRPLLRRK